jgi:protein-tyrosine phosphatase
VSIDPTRVALDVDPTAKRMSGVTLHKGISFDVPFMTEVTGNLWQGGCEAGLELPEFISHVVSLYPWEAYEVSHELNSQLAVMMYDSLGQATNLIDALAQWVNVCREYGPVLVHCQAGLNRSSLVVARALMLGGMTADKAIRVIREKRSPACLCNPAFEKWLRSFDELPES